MDVEHERPDNIDRFDTRFVADTALLIDSIIGLTHGCAEDFTVARMVGEVMKRRKGRSNPVWVAEIARVMGCR
jgi:hypothetical protein